MEQTVWHSLCTLISHDSQVRLLDIGFQLSKSYFQRCDYSLHHIALGFHHVALLSAFIMLLLALIVCSQSL